MLGNTIPINEIIDVQIAVLQPAQSLTFNKLLCVFGTATAITNRVKWYATIEEIVADGYDNTTNVYKAAEVIFQQTPHVAGFYLGLQDSTATETWTQALEAIKAEVDDFYGVFVDSQTSAEIKEVSDWVKEKVMIHFASTVDADVADATLTTDIATILADNPRTFLYWDKLADNKYAVLGLVSKQFTKQAGTSIWALKNITGGTPQATTATERQAVLGKNANIYGRAGNTSLLFKDGKMTNGVFIDLRHATDQLTIDLQAALFTAIVVEEKIPYTDTGIAIIRQIMDRIFGKYIANGVLSDYNIGMPKMGDISVTDKGNRHLPDIKFEAIGAGAIQSMKITGIIGGF